VEQLEAEFALAEETTKVLQMKAEATDAGTIKAKDDSFPIRYKEAQMQLELKNPPSEAVLAKLEREEGMEPVGNSLFACLKKPVCGNARQIPYLKAQFQSASDVILCWSKTKYDPGDSPLHLRMLRTVYKKLSGSKIDIPFCCAQWEVLGFQGSDPRTDLNRNFGILNVLHMLYFVSEHPQLCAQVYQYAKQRNDSINENFPFAPTSINMTKIAMDAFRSGALSKLINPRSSAEAVHTVICEVYLAAYFHIYDEFRKKKLDIHKFSYVYKDAVKLAMTKPAELLRRYEKGVKENRAPLQTVQLDDIENLGGQAVPPPKSQKALKAERREAEKTARRLEAYR
jgi:hypothetical protein